MNFYIHEKLRELENERQAYQLYVEPEKPRRRLLFGGIAAFAGRTLRRTGEGLEGWATVHTYDAEHRIRERAAH